MTTKLTDYTAMTPQLAKRVIDEAISAADLLVESVSATQVPPTYEGTVAPLDRAVVLVGDAAGVGGFMARVHASNDVRVAASEADEKVQKWLAGLAFNRSLYESVRAYADSVDASELVGERRRNLEFWLRDFQRAGQELDPSGRSRLKELRSRLIELQVAYERNLDDFEDAIDLTRTQLAGLPDSYINRLDADQVSGTYRVSVAYPDYVPFMEQAIDRDLRRQLQFKFMNRAADDNIPLLDEAVDVRWAIARVLGYPSFAAYALEPQMADVESVAAFYDSIIPGLMELGRTEMAKLQELLTEDHPGETLQPWDWAYYDAVQRKRNFGVDDNQIAEYFPLDAVVDGMFDVCSEVFGLDFSEITDPKTWHDDVRLYEIRNRDSPNAIAHYYADLHPRQGKYGHAACWMLRAGYATADGYRQPVTAVAANMTKPTPVQPSLLKHDEALTLFHEFGHVLHNALTQAELPRFSGTQTEQDFVEAPSQIMENWMWEPEVLRRFARHYITGEPIPDELVARMVAARHQNVAIKTLRQVFLGHYDMSLHGGDGPTDAVTAYNDNAHLMIIPPHEGTRFGASFGHMMSDGYTAGYYGYLWSNVYGDDMFSVFADRGVLSPEVGMLYRSTVLARGGSADATDLLNEFMGRQPSSEAFMRKIGLG